MVLTRPAPGKHAARSAISHIQRAFKLKDLDPEMALFRAITAEEEAARAIFDALQRHKYSGADRINWRDHRHKAAVMPFFMAIGRSFSQVGFADARTEIVDVEGKKKLVVHVRFRHSDGRMKSWYPDPPLHISVLVDGKREDYAAELQDIATEGNFATMRKFVENYANERNRLLYASAQGVPRLGEPVDGHLATSRANVFSMIAVYLLVDSHPHQQAFVTHALQAFLQMINRLPAS